MPGEGQLSRPTQGRPLQASDHFGQHHAQATPVLLSQWAAGENYVRAQADQVQASAMTPERDQVQLVSKSWAAKTRPMVWATWKQRDELRMHEHLRPGR